MSKLANTKATKRGKRAPFVPGPASMERNAEAARSRKPMRRKANRPKAKGGKR